MSSPIKLAWTGGHDAPWSVLEPISEQFFIDDYFLSVVVPVGFHTDLASVPRPLWAFIPPYGRYIRAAIIHDYLYIKGGLPRRGADRVFLSLMKTDGVPFWKRTLMYAAVRGFGWRGFNYTKT